MGASYSPTHRSGDGDQRAEDAGAQGRRGGVRAHRGLVVAIGAALWGWPRAIRRVLSASSGFICGLLVLWPQMNAKEMMVEEAQPAGVYERAGLWPRMMSVKPCTDSAASEARSMTLRPSAFRLGAVSCQRR